MPALELDSGRPYYRYYIAWTISGDLALEVSLSGVTWSRTVRRAGTFTGTMFIEGDDRLSELFTFTLPGRMSLYVTRNNVPVWGGLISRRSYDAATRVLQLDAVGFESYLYRRQIWHSLSYPNTMDQYQVVRNLINAMQTDFSGVAVPSDNATPHPLSGNIGLQVSGALSGKTQDTQTWYGSRLQSFGEVIEEFSNNLGGFEYYINVDWNTEQDQFIKTLVFRDTPPSQMLPGVPYIGERPGLDENFFEFPGNIMTLSYEDSIDDAATRFYVTGKQPEPVGNVEPPTPRGVYENEPYFSTLWPIFELVESSEHSDVSVQATLDRYAAAYGRLQKPTVPVWSVTVNGQMNPQVGSYEPGDWCRMVITDPFMSQSIESSGELTRVVMKRIIEYTVTVPDTNQLPESVALTLVDEWVEGT